MRKRMRPVYLDEGKVCICRALTRDRNRYIRQLGRGWTLAAIWTVGENTYFAYQKL